MKIDSVIVAAAAPEDSRHDSSDSSSSSSAASAAVVVRDNATSPEDGATFTAGCRFYAVHSLALLDAPGEYYVDAASATLYFLPVAPLLESTEVVVSFLPSVVDGAAPGATFEGITISDAQGDLFASAGADNVTLRASTLSNAGGQCASLDGDGLVVEGNTVFGCGAAGIGVVSGNVATLAPGNSVVTDNAISDFSLVIRTYTPGLSFYGVGTHFLRNNVSDAPHTAVEGSGNDMLFEGNRIVRAAFECTDVGAFYVGRSWSQRGNVARLNYFERVRPEERLAQLSCSQNAFYLDDEMSGWLFENNTVVNSTTGVLLGGGRQNTIRNNVFANNDLDVAFDNRGMNWQLAYCDYNCTDASGVDQPACFRRELEGLHYTQPPYATRYPELPGIFGDHPCVPVGNVVEGNRYCHTRSSKGPSNTPFIDRDADTIASWLSTLGENTEFTEC